MYIKVGKDRQTNENVLKNVVKKKRTIPHGQVKNMAFRKSTPI